jgi:hypothetical protein
MLSRPGWWSNVPSLDNLTVTLQQNMANSLNDIQNYRHLVRYAEWAYDNDDGTQFRSHLPEDELEGRPLAARKVQLSTWSSHNHVHLGIRQRDTLVIAFRGTDFPMKWQNWQKSERWVGLCVNSVTDISCRLTNPTWIEDPNALVHEGFLRDFNGLTDSLTRSIKSLLTHQGLVEPLRIETCGHSLGGALATLCALWCSIEWPQVPITCLTLASPRVGNAHFAAEFKRRANITCYRLVMPSDPIPKNPKRIHQQALEKE